MAGDQTDVFDEAEKQQGDVFDQAAKVQWDDEAKDPLRTGEGMIRNAQNQAHGQAVTALDQAHGALGIRDNGLPSRPESSKATDQAFDAALGSGPSLRPTLRPRIANGPPNMRASANIAEGVPALAGSASLFTPGIAAAPLRTVGALIGSAFGGTAGRAIGETAGLSPENTQSLEDIGTLGGGFAGGTAPERNSWLARASRNAETGAPRIPSVLGTDVKPIADALLPKRTITPPIQEIASARNDMYNDLAERRVNRGTEQSRIDAANEARIRDIEAARLKELGANERLKEQDARARMARKEPPEPEQIDDVAEAIKQGRASRIPTTMPRTVAPPRTTRGVTFEVARPETQAMVPRVAAPPQAGAAQTSMTRATPIQMVDRFSAPEPVQSRIVRPGTPEAEPPHVEGSYWSFKEPALRQSVLSGDRDAAIVYKQRFGELPKGARYLTDVGEKPNRGLYRTEK